MNTNQIALIIVAAGSSSRMGGHTKKEYLPLNRGTVLSEVAHIFLSSGKIDSITVVVPQAAEKNSQCDITRDAEDAFYADPSIKDLLVKNGKSVPVFFVPGGKTRQQSVLNALNFLESTEPLSIIPSFVKPSFVLIHDGARPFLSVNLVNAAVENTIRYNASVPAVKPVDTQKEIDTSGFIKRHLVRTTLCAVQTPQGFSFDAILSAHKKASADNAEYTDDTEIYDRYSGQKTFVFEGETENKKITFKEDIPSNEKSSCASVNKKSDAEKDCLKENKMIHTGIGYDKHRLVEGRKLFIGGVEIQAEKGEDGHSDGDAVLHAITDCLLGASGLGDIGSYFPDTDPKYKDADSKKLLSCAWNDVKNAGWNLENLDCVILLEKPKFLSYRNQVIESIADVLGVSKDKVFLKAKTGEKLGDVGLGNAIEVFATCLLSK